MTLWFGETGGFIPAGTLGIRIRTLFAAEFSLAGGEKGIFGNVVSRECFMKAEPGLLWYQASLDDGQVGAVCE